jgi:hypothetical protein
MFVREADDAVRSVPPLTGQPIPYLDLDVLERALVRANGRQRVGRLGLRRRAAPSSPTCATASASLHRPVGRRDARARATRSARSARRAGRRAGGAVERRARRGRRRSAHARRDIGYPLVVKAAAGGGGRGIRLVHDPRPAKRLRARPRGGRRSFGDATLFMEQLVTDARHIEVQVIADHHGTCGRRACATARSSAATRRCSRSRHRRPSTPTRRPSWPRRPPSSRVAGYTTPARSSSSTSPRSAVRVPGGQHPPAGRASGDRADHRHRPRQAAAARGRRREPRRRCAPDRRARHRGAPQRRGRRARVQPLARGHRAAEPADGTRASGSTPG